jgi:hypothetical protein
MMFAMPDVSTVGDGGEEPQGQAGALEEQTGSLKSQVESFVAAHPDLGLGSFVGAEALPDWARGQRQRVTLTSGDYRVYFFDGEVVTVQRLEGPDGIVEVYRKEIPLEPSPVKAGERVETAELPRYEILSTLRQMSGRVWGDVLIESFSRGTPADEREAVIRQIAAREGLDDVSLYCSRDAYEADMSSPFAEAHPEALPKCGLGTLQNGRFESYDKLYAGPDE